MDEAPEISLTEHQRYWLNHVRACEASGKRITEYATDQGLGVRAMYDGKRALVKKGVLPRTHATRFQRAQVVDPVMGNETENFCSLNINLIRLFMNFLSLEKANIYRSSDMPVSGTKADLLVSICKYLRSEKYLSAPGSREYLEKSHAFEDAGIQGVYLDYKHPVYKQLFWRFRPVYVDH